MSESTNNKPETVLNNVKKHVQVASDYDVFDEELINHINTALFTLYETITMTKIPFLESKEQTWEEVLGADVMEQYALIPTYVGSSVKLIFDTPTNSFTIEALKNQIKMFEYRMSDKDTIVQREVGKDAEKN